MNHPYKAFRKIVIAVVGFTVIAIGLALLVLPGPGILVIIGGLAILAIEFEWAKRRLETVKARADQLAKKARLKKEKPGKNT